MREGLAVERQGRPDHGVSEGAGLYCALAAECADWAVYARRPEMLAAAVEAAGGAGARRAGGARPPGARAAAGQRRASAVGVRTPLRLARSLG